MRSMCACLLCAAAACAAAEPLLVKGALVYTITGPVLKDADILMKDGVIAEVGHSIAPPQGAKVVDARGKVAMPGFVVAQNLGIFGRGGSIPESIDVFGTAMKLAVGAGVTAVCCRDSVIKMTCGDPEGVLLAPCPSMSASLSWSGKERFRRALMEAREQLRRAAQAEEMRGQAAPQAASPYVRVLRGELPVRVSLDRAQDLLWAARMAREFNIRFIIEGAVESWTVADELGRAKASVVLSVRVMEPPPETPDDPPGSNERVASILAQAGVPFALVPPSSGVTNTGGFAGRDIMAMPMEAAFAVRGGLDEAAALAAITIEPARILGVEQRIGSLEEGKDADLVILDGDPLHYKTFVDMTIINGKVYFDRAQSDVFPRPEQPPAPEPRPQPPQQPEQQTEPQPQPQQPPPPPQPQPRPRPRPPRR